MKAYPFSHKHPTTGITTSSEGMDLRDYFAASALQGFLAHTPWEVVIKYEQMSKKSYDMADAMLEARERRDEQS